MDEGMCSAPELLTSSYLLRTFACCFQSGEAVGELDRRENTRHFGDYTECDFGEQSRFVYRILHSANIGSGLDARPVDPNFRMWIEQFTNRRREVKTSSCWMSILYVV